MSDITLHYRESDSAFDAILSPPGLCVTGSTPAEALELLVNAISVRKEREAEKAARRAADRARELEEARRR